MLKAIYYYSSKRTNNHYYSQLDAIEKFISAEKMELCGKFYDVPINDITDPLAGYKKFIKKMHGGDFDTVVIWSFERFISIPKELKKIFQIIVRKKIEFISIKDQIDTRKKSGKNFIRLLMLFSESKDENSYDQKRRSINYGGRGRPALKASLVQKIIELRSAGISVNQIAKVTNVSRSACYSTIKKSRN